MILKKKRLFFLLLLLIGLCFLGLYSFGQYREFSKLNRLYVHHAYSGQSKRCRISSVRQGQRRGHLLMV